MKQSAVVQLWDDDFTARELKRLALLFDEICVLHPSARFVAKEAISDPARVIQRDDGNLVLGQSFDLFRDTERWELGAESWRSQQLREVVSQFSCDGVSRRLAPEGEASPFRRDSGMDSLRDRMIQSDVADAEFVKISRCSVEQRAFTTRAFTYSEDNGSHPAKHGRGMFVGSPLPFEHSFEIATVCGWASEIDASPLFLDRRFRAYLAYKYECATSTLSREKFELFGVPKSVARRRLAFGATAFLLTNNILTSSLIDELSPQDVLRLRKTLHEPRERFVAAHLNELATMLEDDPWTDAAEGLAATFVREKIEPAMHKYRDASRDAVNGLFGKVAVRAAPVVVASIGGAVAGGLGGAILPGVTAWNALLLSAMAAWTKEARGLTKDVIEFLADRRDLRRSGIAYLAAIKNATKR